MPIDTNELRRKVNSTDIVDHIDLHANIKPFLSEMIDRLEAAEKAVTESYQRGYETGQEEVAAERDALRTKIEQMERQEPVAFGLYSGWALKATYLKEHEACEQRDRRQLTADLGGSIEAYRVAPLYALPGAQGEEK